MNENGKPGGSPGPLHLPPSFEKAEAPQIARIVSLLGLFQLLLIWQDNKIRENLSGAYSDGQVQGKNRQTEVRAWILGHICYLGIERISSQC